MNDQDRPQDPGHGEPGHVHDENWNGAAELGMSVGGLAGIAGGGEAVGGAAAGPSDHADEETKQETGTADDSDPGPSEPSRR
jgi:hypothetical protein